jgi:hypothetical protein
VCVDVKWPGIQLPPLWIYDGCRTSSQFAQNDTRRHIDLQRLIVQQLWLKLINRHRLLVRLNPGVLCRCRWQRYIGELIRWYFRCSGANFSVVPLSNFNWLLRRVQFDGSCTKRRDISPLQYLILYSTCICWSNFPCHDNANDVSDETFSFSCESERVTPETDHRQLN